MLARLLRVKVVHLQTGSVSFLDRPNTYAIVVEGKPFVITYSGTHPLARSGNRYTCKEVISTAPNTRAIVAARQETCLYEVELNHLNGAPVLRRKIPAKSGR